MIRRFGSGKWGVAKLGATVGAVVVGLALTASIATSEGTQGQVRHGAWTTGDLHTHTYLTDGENTEAQVVDKAFNTYGLDWMANSEHGGTSARNPLGSDFSSPVWRWITLSLYSYPIVAELRTQHSDKLIVQGVEWNVPTHEHASVGIVADEPAAVSNFEYRFDSSDTDTSRTLTEGLVKTNATHDDAVAGVAWLGENYGALSYFVPNHPSRKLKYSVADLRDFNNAAPNVAFGIEGMPGHQKESSRGGYTSADPRAQTYGGADIMIAKVGGLWDAMLGEGRRFWTFTDSDFHEVVNDFWPGEYSKSYVFVDQTNDYASLVAGMRSGNVFDVEGDLINALDFSIKNGKKKATMGQELTAKKGDRPMVTVRFRSPNLNNAGQKPVVDHIDLIAGSVTGMTTPGTLEYSLGTNPTTGVIATFTKSQWKKEDGWYSVTFKLPAQQGSRYLRLRGTNMGLSASNQTDASGNPLADSLMGANTPAQAYADLWFYSNPIFVTTQP
jgi:hypothetical protein